LLKCRGSFNGERIARDDDKASRRILKHRNREATTMIETRRAVPGGGSTGNRSKSLFHSHGGFLDGQMLVAMPGMADDRFARSVIYLCAHSEEGAMGIVINRPASKVRFPDLLVQLEVIGEDEAIRLPNKAGAMQVLKGGPVETQRGFVLHSNDFFIDNSTLPIDQKVSLTATVDILRAIASGSGPDRAVLALGYAGWQAGQPA
jgi:putative transcriptional regulator